MLKRTALTLLATAALGLSAPAHAYAPTAVGTDDPTTFINEAARLNPSRVQVVGGPRAASSMDLALAYAKAHGLTSCGAPASAKLDDVFLVRAVHPVDGQPYDQRIRPVGLDTALAGQGKFIVVLACAR